MTELPPEIITKLLLGGVMNLRTLNGMYNDQLYAECDLDVNDLSIIRPAIRKRIDDWNAAHGKPVLDYLDDKSALKERQREETEETNRIMAAIKNRTYQFTEEVAA